MENLFRFIFKHHFTLLFVILEFFCLTLVIQNNVTKTSTMLGLTNAITGFFYEKTGFIREYKNAKIANRQLLDENNRLHNNTKNYYLTYTNKFKVVEDSVLVNDSIRFAQHYQFTSATVVNSFRNTKSIYFTLDKGRRQGIEKDMGVATSEGVVGLIVETSENFSLAISILNSRLALSAKMKKSGYQGTIEWTGTDYRVVKLKEIANNIPLVVGDTIITSGFSTVFPEGIVVGTVKDFKTEHSDNYWDIRVNLAADLKKVSYVYIIKDLHKQEEEELEKKTTDD